MRNTTHYLLLLLIAACSPVLGSITGEGVGNSGGGGSFSTGQTEPTTGALADTSTGTWPGTGDLSAETGTVDDSTTTTGTPVTTDPTTATATSATTDSTATTVTTDSTTTTTTNGDDTSTTGPMTTVTTVDDTTGTPNILCEPCAAQQTTCETDVDCKKIWDCSAGCPETKPDSLICIQACVCSNPGPAGADKFVNWTACYNDLCTMACPEEKAACQQNVDCNALMNCINSCPACNAQCQTDCKNFLPNGQDLYNNWLVCGFQG